MYRPLEKYAKIQGIPLDQIEELFQKRYQELAGKRGTNPHLLSQQLGIEPSEETLSSIFQPYMDKFITMNRTPDFKNTWSEIEELEETLQKKIPEKVLENGIKTCIEKNEKKGIEYLTGEKHLKLPKQAVLEGLVNYVDHSVGTDFINMYLATKIEMPEETLETIYEKLARDGRFDYIDQLEKFFTSKPRGERYAKGIITFLETEIE